MKSYHFFLVVIPASAAFSCGAEVPRLHDEYDPDKWPHVELKLSVAANLKDIFDAGLRPYRHPGLENSLLEVKHVNLRIQMGSGKELPELQLELVNLTPFRDGEIATMEGFTSRLTLAQARAEMLKWLPHGTNGRTEKELDDFLLAVKSDFVDFDDRSRGISHGCGLGWQEPGFGNKGGGAKFGIGFRKTASQNYPLRLHFGLDWGLNRPFKDRGSYRPHPIEPPAGYENVDMTAPKKFGPDSMAEILESKGVDIGRGRAPVAPVTQIPPGFPAASSPALGKVRWLLLILLALSLLAAVLLRLLRRNP